MVNPDINSETKKQITEFGTSINNIQSALKEGKRIGFRKAKSGNVEVYGFSKWKFWELWGSNQELLKTQFEKMADTLLQNEIYPNLRYAFTGSKRKGHFLLFKDSVNGL